MHINTMGKTRPLCKKKSGQSWTAHEVCHCIEACCYFSGLATENSRWRPFRTPPLEKGSHFCIHHENILDLTPTQDDRHIHEFFSLGVPDPLKRHHPGVDETSQHLILGGGGVDPRIGRKASLCTSTNCTKWAVTSWPPFYLAVFFLELYYPGILGNMKI